MSREGQGGLEAGALPALTLLQGWGAQGRGAQGRGARGSQGSVLTTPGLPFSPRGLQPGRDSADLTAAGKVRTLFGRFMAPSHSLFLKPLQKE